MATHEQELHMASEAEEETGVELAPLPAGDVMIDSQIATAKRYPRSIARFRKSAEELATYDEETAGECFYALKRSGKVIEGPSARFAEILLYSWGNARADAEVVEVGEKTLTSQGTFFDLERNVAIRKKVERRITDSHNRRYSDDMITVTGNAANSIALRNVVFAGVPKALWKQIYLKARRVAIGDAGSMAQTRQKLVEHFGKMGVESEKVFAYLGVHGIEDIGEDQIILMRGLANAIRDSEITVEEAFAPERPARGARSDINERLQEPNGAAPTPEQLEEAAAEVEQKRAARKRKAAEKERVPGEDDDEQAGDLSALVEEG